MVIEYQSVLALYCILCDNTPLDFGNKINHLRDQQDCFKVFCVLIYITKNECKNL